MTTTLIPLSGIEGVNYNTTYTAYDQTAAISSTNSPDNPGPPFTVGTVSKGTGDSEFVFVKAGATINLGDCCIVTSTTQLANPVTTTLALKGVQVGFAQVPIANGAFGWLQRAGACSNINCLAVVQNVQLAATATPGVLDDVVTVGLKNIDGVVVTTSGGPGVLAGTLNQSVVGITNP